jgi:hypothetical protein
MARILGMRRRAGSPTIPTNAGDDPYGGPEMSLDRTGAPRMRSGVMRSVD